MTIELPAGVEKQLEHLAVTQHRDIGEIIEEAIRLYLEAAAFSEGEDRALSERGLAEWADMLDQEDHS